MLTLGAFAALLVFGVVDAAAHFTGYRYGKTVSATVWYLEKGRWWVRALVGALTLLLGSHLVFHLP